MSPKCYSLLIEDEQGKAQTLKRSKGVHKHLLKTSVKHEHYKNCILGESEPVVTFQQLVTRNFNIYRKEFNKKSLSTNENKRNWFNCNICSVPKGYLHKTNFDPNLHVCPYDDILKDERKKLRKITHPLDG